MNLIPGDLLAKITGSHAGLHAQMLCSKALKDLWACHPKIRNWSEI